MLKEQGLRISAWSDCPPQIYAVTGKAKRRSAQVTIAAEQYTSKKLKTDREDPFNKIRNRSKSRTKNMYK